MNDVFSLSNIVRSASLCRKRLSNGNTLYLPASAHHNSTNCRSLLGCFSAKSWHSEKSSSTLYSSHLSSSKLHPESLSQATLPWNVTAIHPLYHNARLPSISKYCICLVEGALASLKL